MGGSSSKTRYLPHRQGQEAQRAVDKRSGELNSEYISKARAADQMYCGTEVGTIGPVETKLGSLGEVRGIVVGAFGEGSEHLHNLIHHLAVSRVQVAIRRTLSLVRVRAQARLLLGRLEVI